MLFPILAALSVIISLVAGYSYIRDTLKGTTQPNRVSWLLWGIIPMISVSATLSEGLTLAVIPVFMAGFIPFLVIFASFKNKKSKWELKALDYTCGAISVLAIVLWMLTNNPLLAVILAVLADGLAAIPTLKKSWFYPETESWGPYFAGFFGGISGIVIAQGISLEYIFPAYLLIFNSIMLIFLFRKNLKLSGR